ncbi:MAG: prephenate dehydratase [Bacillota bacterium]
MIKETALRKIDILEKIEATEMTMGYLGPTGTYSWQAANLAANLLQNQDFSRKMQFQGLTTISDVLWQVQEGKLDMGIVPIENSIEGAVTVTMDVLTHEVDLDILAELVLDIEHYLISLETKLSSIKRILSHPQALAQCRRNLQKLIPQGQLVATNSSAEAVEKLKGGEKGLAALASKNAALEYGLPLISDNLNDYPVNQTRFIIVGNKGLFRLKAQINAIKTSLVFILKENRPGGLYSALKHFAEEKVNLTRIESRPSKRKLGEYLFYIDCEGFLDDQNMKKAMDNLREDASFLKVFGSYPRLL